MLKNAEAKDEVENKKRYQNPFGYIDHAEFAGFGIQLAYGKLPDGSMFHISHAESGLKCGCVCPACDKALIAKKGPEKSHHFAHAGQGEGCGYGPETNAHIWAKEVLERELKIKLPARIAEFGGKRVVTSAAKVFEFVSAKLERRMGKIVPDVILTAPDGREFVVEVKVTHASTEAKKEEMRRTNLAGIEVDLSAYRTSTDFTAVKLALLYTAPRTWLFNPKIQDDIGKIAAKLEEERQKKAREVIAHEKRLNEIAEAKRQKILERAQSVVESLRLQNYDLDYTEPFVSEWIVECGLDEFLDVHMAAKGFSVPQIVWQSQLLEWCAHSIQNWQTNLTIDDAVEAIGHCIQLGFQGELDDEVRHAVRKIEPSWAFPKEAIESFVWSLRDYGLLIYDKYADKLSVSTDWQIRISDIKRSYRERQQRQTSLQFALNDILNDLPAVETAAFNRVNWLETPMQSFEASPIDLAVSGGLPWDGFYGKLSGLANMRRGGGDTDVHPLGLPVEAAIERAVDQRIKSAKAAANQRVEWLRAKAVDLLGVSGDHWLHCASNSEVNEPIILARLSEAGKDIAYSALLVETDRRQREHESTLAMESFKTELRKAVESSPLSELEARMFLANHTLEFGKSPISHCIDKCSLKECKNLLASRLKQGGRRKR